MAKPTTKAKKAKKTKPRKPQPLPRSVQALLKYLGGSDVKLGGARGGQPATLAPTSINIAVSQQQAQQQQQAQAQQQQFVQQRVAPKGEIISRSPLAAVAAQPIIIQNAPQRRSDYERIDEDKERQAREAETRQKELNRRFGLLEASQEQFKQQAVQAYQDVKQDINRRVAGDANIFDARNIAARFSARPQVEEAQFAGVQVGEEAPVEWTEVTEQGIYQAGQYVANVTNPEMTQIERAKRGRRPLDPVIKAARAREAQIAKESIREIRASVKAEKKESKKNIKITPDVANLLEENITAANVIKQRAPSPPNIIRRFTGPPPRKTVSTTGAPDMASQIAMLTGGGAALPPQSQGRTIADILGAKKK